MIYVVQSSAVFYRYKILTIEYWNTIILIIKLLQNNQTVEYIVAMVNNNQGHTTE